MSFVPFAVFHPECRGVLRAPAPGEAELRIANQEPLPWHVWALLCRQAYLEHTLHPEGFCFASGSKTPSGTALRQAVLPKWDSPTRLTGEFCETSPHLYRGEKTEKPHRQKCDFFRF